MKKFTILSIAFPFAIVTADPVGGAEQVLVRIDTALRAAGHRSIVVAAEGSTTSDELVSLPRCVSATGEPQWRSVHDVVRETIARLLRSESVDLIHLHGVDFPSYLPPTDVRVLATLHLPLSQYPAGTLELARPRTWLNTVSRHQHAEAGMHPYIAGPIENGVEIVAATAGPKADYALALGRICPEKGFHLALDAARIAGIALKLAGSVSDFPEHRQYFEQEIKPRLDELRQWVGPVSGAAKRHLLQSARCVLVPSLVPETASLVAREALAAGTAVVAYPSGALAETVDHGRTGFLVHNVEEMSRALLRTDQIDPEQCRSVARRRYSVASMTEQYLNLYARLVETV